MDLWEVPPSLVAPRYVVSAIHVAPCETYLPHEVRRREPL